ncbi:peptidase A4 family-domain-containing protein [Lentinula aciculospora]|uniref:Peptidase A4 family-domain-containing protein n=1 Tax=Lentinula aciculospora TaxID=153920 RepID=A0A9W8ZV43_9AGAR|nr:peptidase A4 family-domain-containing protein [Lentinula aciculospora]
MMNFRLFTLLTSFTLLFCLTIARPSGSGLAVRFAARESRTSRPFINSTDTPNKAALVSNAAQDLYSTNWAGGLLESPPVGQRFTDVGGTFIVPTLDGNNGDGAMSAWIGIDGGPNAPEVILQTGVDCYSISGVQYSFAWFEWYPQYAFEFTNFFVSAGHTIALRVQAVNSTAGIVTLTNESTGQAVSEEVLAPDDNAALLGETAEWIVEDFEQDDELVPFASFGEVQFTDAAAFTGVEEIFASVGVAVDMVQNNAFLAITRISENVVTIDYA